MTLYGPLNLLFQADTYSVAQMGGDSRPFCLLQSHLNDLGTDMHTTLENTLRNSIRTIADYPKPGIQFRDITTLLGNARAFRRAIDELVQPYAGTKVDQIAGIEARGFILGGAMAHQLSSGFVPIRKKGQAAA